MKLLRATPTHDRLMIESYYDSTNVLKIDYHLVEKTLYVTFIKGGKYKYENFPEDLYVKMNFSDSIGKFLHKEVFSKYKGELIEKNQNIDEIIKTINELKENKIKQLSERDMD